ncbi:MAG TPA: integrin alpha [Candidatus Binatia bacterium]|nr:integrin alpha [Candidatus Binatia bacterium]
MNFTSCKLQAGLGLATVVIMTLPAAALAQPFHVPCQTGGDQMGFAVAANGDFNGDGVNDIAVGAPCTYAHGHVRAGRVVVLDGRNGKRLFSKRGSQDGAWMGAAVSFIRDVNGDGRDELAVGSPGYDVTPYDQRDPTVRTKDQAGRVDVYHRTNRRMSVFGTNAHSGFGEKIAPLNDVNGDGREDFVVSASTDSLPRGRSQPGRVWIVSGRNGDFLGFKVGPKAGKNYGRSLAAAEDIDGDGVVDFLTGSDEVNIFQVRRAGVVDLVSPNDLEDELFRVVGAKRDGIGKSVDYAGDVLNDGIKDFIAGSDGSDDTGVKLAGLVTLFGVDGERHWVKADTEIQENARFGDAVATIGDIDGDLITDFAAAASQFDVFVDEAKAPDGGRVVTLSGVDGSQIWEQEGDRREEQFGFSLDGGVDFNLDEIPDVIVGTLGDAPFGRRGAGTMRILSGEDGSELFSFAGRRGLETRIVTAIPATPTAARLRSFNRTGRRMEMNTLALEGIQLGELDVTVLNERGANVPIPKIVQAAISTGHGATDSTVEVYRLGRKDKLVDRFRAFPVELQTGAECDGGEIDQEINEDLVCAQSDSEDGNVLVRVFKRLHEEEPFFIFDEFPVFTAGEAFNEFFNIDAEGATVAVGDVVGSAEDEIIVGTTRGLPVVRVYTGTGTLLSQFLAYDPIEFSGVDVAVINLSGSGDRRILTAPRQGNALIKVFDAAGNRVTFGRDNDLISIMARPPSYTGGARVAAADIDLDERQEILVLIPRPEGGHEVLAYEGTNEPVRPRHFHPFNPTPDGEEGGSIAGTDRFVRN